MIMLTKLNGADFMLNCDHIETIMESPDTTITLENGKIYIVKESMSEIEDLVIRFRRSTLEGCMRGIYNK